MGARAVPGWEDLGENKSAQRLHGNERLERGRWPPSFINFNDEPCRSDIDILYRGPPSVVSCLAHHSLSYFPAQLLNTSAETSPLNTPTAQGDHLNHGGNVRVIQNDKNDLIEFK